MNYAASEASEIANLKGVARAYVDGANIVPVTFGGLGCDSRTSKNIVSLHSLPGD